MSKKYKIGYTSGAYDLFHIGHLNLLKKAKELCEYLIVDIYTDDVIKGYKKSPSIIGEEQRAAIVSAIRYVDKVHMQNTLDKISAYNNYKFDAIFIGNDWENSDRWNTICEQMKPLGVDVLFLPYTSGISTSSIKEKIRQG